MVGVPSGSPPTVTALPMRATAPASAVCSETVAAARSSPQISAVGSTVRNLAAHITTRRMPHSAGTDITDAARDVPRRSTMAPTSSRFADCFTRSQTVSSPSA